MCCWPVDLVRRPGIVSDRFRLSITTLLSLAGLQTYPANGENDIGGMLDGYLGPRCVWLTLSMGLGLLIHSNFLA
jgi:hypothetical protein